MVPRVVALLQVWLQPRGADAAKGNVLLGRLKVRIWSEYPPSASPISFYIKYHYQLLA